ncbi:MAG: hypothetical protein LBK52_03970 [Deltaproteobacteria bacterium]|jgi:hypothetical protein|nr:hypothetical protein [Deltaproteobacteria bacterium]
MFRRFFFWIITGALALLISSGFPGASGSAGSNDVLPPVFPPSPPGVLRSAIYFSPVPPVSPEVLYYYTYSCPLCTITEKDLIPRLERQFPPGTKLTKLPFLGPSQTSPWYSHGRMALALELMGIEEELHQAIMERIQSADPAVKEGKYNEVKVLVSAEEQADFIAGLGYSREEYLKVLNSPECQVRLNRLWSYQLKNTMPSVPAMIFHGFWYYTLNDERPEIAAKSIVSVVLRVWNDMFSQDRPQSPPVQPSVPRPQPPGPQPPVPVPVPDGEAVRPLGIRYSGSPA